ncbi:isocitrate/isopropylmalate family dehydrogenase, partial [Burkholderia cepacia]
MARTYRIATIPGDGIGKEVMPEAIRVLDVVKKRYGIGLDYQHVAWGSCDYYAQHGKMMPDDWKAQLSGMDAILFGAVGWPATVP